ncbi:hypothetical protein JW707_00945 [Candidatus Woesearchaeota archaeon]|nr:hypothetical protein [Candidatus Woesearchaeota archaeon]
MSEAKLYYNIAGLDWLYFVNPADGTHSSGDFEESSIRGILIAEEIIDLFPDSEYTGESRTEKSSNPPRFYKVEEFYKAPEFGVTLTKVCVDQPGLEYRVVTELLVAIDHPSVAYCLRLIGLINGIVDSHYKENSAVPHQHSASWRLFSSGKIVVQFPEQKKVN